MHSATTKTADTSRHLAIITSDSMHYYNWPYYFQLVCSPEIEKESLCNGSGRCREVQIEPLQLKRKKNNRLHESFMVIFNISYNNGRIRYRDLSPPASVLQCLVKPIVFWFTFCCLFLNIHLPVNSPVSVQPNNERNSGGTSVQSTEGSCPIGAERATVKRRANDIICSISDDRLPRTV